jgi:hypothetical protein
MANKIVLHCFGCVAIVMLQLAFITTFPAPINSLQLLLSIVIFMTVIGAYRTGLWWAWGGGLLLELFSPHFFGIQLLALVLSVVGVHYLFINLFTNYSFYSVTVLSIVGSVWFAGIQVLATIIGPVVSIIPPAEFSVWSYIGWQTAMNVLVVYALFLLMHYLTKRFSLNIGTNNHV